MNPISTIFCEIPENHLKLEALVCQSHFADIHKGSYQDNPVAIKKIVVGFSESFQPSQIHNELGCNYLLHPNILPFYGYSIIDTYIEPIPSRNIALIHEWMPLNLESIIKTERLAKNNLRKIERGLTIAVEFLHSKRIVHQKLKSTNVFLTNDYQVKLAHINLPNLYKECEEKCGGQNRKGSNISYRATETFNRWEATFENQKRADIYSLGMLLWVIRAWQEPHVQDTAMGLLGKKKAGIQETIPSDCSKSRASLIQDCWKRASERPIALQVKERLETIHQEEIAEETSLHKLP